MVAIFTGSGTGLERGSGGVLGGAGLLGSATLGSDGSQLLLNAATGNLIIQRRDEFLVGRGPDAVMNRTYNSRGDLGDGIGSDWQFGTDRRIFGLQGGQNAPGSTIRRLADDGSIVTYTWDSTANAYIGKEGAGAYDRIEAASCTAWAWTDGSTQDREIYGAPDGTGGYRLTQEIYNGQSVYYSYNGNNQLASITTDDGAQVNYAWNGNAVTQITTNYINLDNGNASSLVRARYSYDSQGRLAAVTTDLSPQDGSTADGNVYVTNYGYDTGSNRINSVSETDGSQVNFAYDGQGRVTSFSQAVGNGVWRTSSIAYNGGSTTITDASGQVTTLQYNGDRSLAAIIAPPASYGASQQITRFTYDAKGDIASVTDPMGAATQYLYDDRGNNVATLDPDGTEVLRTFNAANKVLTETTNANRVRDPAGADGWTYPWNPNGIASGPVFSDTWQGKTYIKGTFQASGPDQWLSIGNSRDHLFDVVGGEKLLMQAGLEAQGPIKGTLLRVYWSNAQGNEIGSTDLAGGNGSLGYDTKVGAVVDVPQSAVLGRFEYYVGTSGPGGGFFSIVEPSVTRVPSGQTGLTIPVKDAINIGNATSTDGWLYQWNPDGIASAPIVSGMQSGKAYIKASYQASGPGKWLSISNNSDQNHDHMFAVRGGDKLLIQSGIEAQGPIAQYILRVYWADANGNQFSQTDLGSGTGPQNYDTKVGSVVDVPQGAAFARFEYYIQTSAAGSGSFSMIEPSATRVPPGQTGLDIPSDANGWIYPWNPNGIASSSVMLGVQSGKSYIQGNFQATGADQNLSIGNSRDRAFMFSVVGGEKLFMQAGTEAQGPIKSTLLRVYWFDSNGNEFTQTDIGGKSGPQGFDTKIGAFVDVPQGATVGRFEYYVTTSGVGNGSLALDEPTVVRVPTGQADVGGSAPSTKRFVYDGMNRLRFAIDAEGGVTEYCYGAYSRLEQTRVYAGPRFPSSNYGPNGTPTDNDVNNWLDSVGRGSAHTTQIYYDARSNVSAEVSFGFAGDHAETQTDAGYSETLYHYDQAGQLIGQSTVHPSQGNYPEAVQSESFAYDGLGRQIASTDLNGGTTRIAFDDPNSRTFVNFANGLSDMSVYDRAGELVAHSQWGNWLNGGTATAQYDVLGRPRVQTDASGLTTYTFYDEVGRKVADVTQDGQFTEYRYDADDRLTATIHYAQLANGGQLGALANPNWMGDISQLRPPADGADLCHWNVWDAEGRLAGTIDGAGEVTQYGYDVNGGVAFTRVFANRLGGDALAAFRQTPPTTLPTPWPSDSDVVTRNFYDHDGRLIGSLDGEGYLTRIDYDAAGEKVQETAYANATAPWQRFSGSFAQLVASVGSSLADRQQHWAYDGQGLLRFAVDASGAVTEFRYDEGEQLTTNNASKESIRYGGTLPPLGSYTVTSIANAITAAGLNGRGDNRVSFSIYDGSGRVAFDIDAAGAVTGYSYDAEGHVTKTVQYAATWNTNTLPRLVDGINWSNAVASAADRVTRHYYDAAGNERFTVDAEGYVTGTEYDAAGRVVHQLRWDNPIAVGDWANIGDVAWRIGGHAAETRFGYDAMGRLNDTSNGDGGHTHQIYNANGTLAFSIAAYGTADESRTYYEYDAAGRKIAQTAAWGQACTSRTTYAYDGLGNLRTITDPNGGVTRMDYDHDGRLLATTDAVGGVTSHQFNAFGEEVRVTDARGASTWSYYDLLGRVTAVRDAEDYVTQTLYDTFGDISSVTRRANRAWNGANTWDLPQVNSDGADATTSFAYDKLGRVVSTTDAEGGYEAYTLDAFGQRIAVQNKIGGVTHNAYDRRGLLVSETLPSVSYNEDGSVQGAITNTYSYDARGNLVRKVEAAGLREARTTRYAYDDADRLIETRGDAVSWVDTDAYNVHGPTEPVERMAYDARGDLIEKVDARGARTQFWYDGLGRTVASIDGVGAMTTWAYNGYTTTERRYGNLVGQSFQSGGAAPWTPGGDVRETLSTYDALGRLHTVTIANVRTGWFNGGYQSTAGDVTTTYDYDANGNVLRVTDGAGNATYTTYDRLGRKVRQVDAEGYETGWLYDAQGNVYHERRWSQRAAGYGLGWINDSGLSWDDRLTNFSYDRMGRRLTETRLNVEAYWVDGNGNLNQQSNQSNVTYQYNGLGQVISKTEATGEATRYNYDTAGRLMTETRAGYYDANGNYVQPQLNYRYDGLGDIVRAEQSAQGGGDARVTLYRYGAGGRLSQMIDANGAWFNYYQNVAGDVVAKTWYRNGSSGSGENEGMLYVRDVLGRVVSQGTAYWNGSWHKADTQETRYNAFGEVSQQGINGLQQQFDYDAMGQVWRTNSGDGVWRYFMHDGAGRRTLTLESAGAYLDNMSLDDALNRATNGNEGAIGSSFVSGYDFTIAAYDRRGQMTATWMPQRQRSLNNGDITDLWTFRNYNAFGDVVSDRDARGVWTNYAYNSMGRLTQTTHGGVWITNEDGSSQVVNPTEKRFYDLAGRQVGMEDANGHRTTQQLLAGTGYDGSQGLVTAEWHPDGGVVRSGFDRFGNNLWHTDEVGRTTWMGYDNLGHLTGVNRPGGTGEGFAYDILGQRIRHWSTVLDANHADLTDYDVQGRVVRTQSFGGDVVNTSYSWDGGISTTGMGTFGGWTQVTSYANGRSSTEQTDVFGHSVFTIDLGGHRAGTYYDRGGRIDRRWGDEGVHYQYLNTGLVGSIATDNNEVTTYAYDENGNRTGEYYSVNGTLRRNMEAQYDALGRMTLWYEKGSPGAPESHLNWAYDAAGNIRRTAARYTQFTSGSNGGQYVNDEERWYTYDAMNRVVVDRGTLVNGQIVRGAIGTDFTYDQAGERMTATRTFQTQVQVQNPYYDSEPYGDGRRNGSQPTIWVAFTSARRDTYSYTRDGQLQSVSSAHIGAYDDGDGNAVSTGQFDTADGASSFDYDGQDRLVHQLDRNANGQTVYERSIGYDWGTQRATSETVTQRQGSDTVTSTTNTDYGSGGDYALGAAVTQTTSSWKNGNYQGQTTTNNQYTWFNGAVVSSAATYGLTNSNTCYNYDGLGELTQVRINDGRSRTISYLNDADGQTIQRDETDDAGGATPHEVWYRFNGHELGHLGNNAARPDDYTSSDQQRQLTASSSNAFGTGDVDYGSDFASDGPTAITSYNQGSAGGSYTVRSGDTLSSIAYALWGDSSLWYKLAQANSLTSDGGLAAGQVLTVPSGVMRSTLNASTFKPFDPAAALGDVNPVDPAPQPQAAAAPHHKGGGCGILGAIITAVVAIAVAVVLPEVAGTYFGAGGLLGGGALNGAVTGVIAGAASQGVAVATGIQDKFSWTGVALAGIAGGVGGALGGANAFGTASGIAKVGSDVVRGALSNLVTQGIGVATGLQSKFDWAGVAVGGAVGGVIGAAARGLQAAGVGIAAENATATTVHDFGYYANLGLSGAAGAIAGAATRSLANGTDFGDNIIAALPDVIGNTIGSLVAGEITGRGGSGEGADEEAPANSADGSLRGLSFDPNNSPFAIPKLQLDLPDLALPVSDPAELASLAAAGVNTGSVLKRIVSPEEYQRLANKAADNAQSSSGSPSQSSIIDLIATGDGELQGRTTFEQVATTDGATRFYGSHVGYYETSDNKTAQFVVIEASERAMAQTDLLFGAPLAAWAAPLSAPLLAEGGLASLLGGVALAADSNHVLGGSAPFTGATQLPLDYVAGHGASTALDIVAGGSNLAYGGYQGIRSLLASGAEATPLFASGNALNAIPLARSASLAEVSTTAELLEHGLVPGPEGVTLAQRSVSFSDLWSLSDMHGAEFALTKEDGAWRLYSGSANTVRTPLTEDVTVWAHTHPGGTDMPSMADIRALNANYDAKLAINPAARPTPSRVVYGPGLGDYTRFWPTNR